MASPAAKYLRKQEILPIRGRAKGERTALRRQAGRISCNRFTVAVIVPPHSLPD
jgi:hypothetical protein